MTQKRGILLTLVALCSALNAHSTTKDGSTGRFPPSVLDEILQPLSQQLATLEAKQNESLLRMEANLKQELQLLHSAIAAAPWMTAQTTTASQRSSFPQSHSLYSSPSSPFTTSSSIRTLSPFAPVALQLAASIGDTEELQRILAAGVDPDAQYADGRTALALAVQHQHTNCVVPLLRAGADRNTRIASWYNGTVLMRTAFDGHVDALRALLAAGADTDFQDKDGFSALHWAAFSDHAEVIPPLVAAGGNVDAKDDEGFTPLILASWKSNEASARALMAAGADVNAKNKYNDTALMWVSQHGYMGIARALLDAGADVMNKNQQGYTSLHLAAWKGHTDLVGLLLKHGARVFATNNEGETPLDVAKTDEVRRLLRSPSPHSSFLHRLLPPS